MPQRKVFKGQKYSGASKSDSIEKAPSNINSQSTKMEIIIHEIKIKLLLFQSHIPSRRIEVYILQLQEHSTKIRITITAWSFHGKLLPSHYITCTLYQSLHQSNWTRLKMNEQENKNSSNFTTHFNDKKNTEVTIYKPRGEIGLWYSACQQQVFSL